MKRTLEERIEHLEKMVEAQAKLNFILFPLLVPRDDRQRKNVAEVLRQLLVSPAAELSPELSMQVTALRDILVLPIPQEVVEASRRPSIRPVE